MIKLILSCWVLLISLPVMAEVKVGCPGMAYYPFCSKTYSVHIQNDDQSVYTLHQYMGWKKSNGTHSANVCLVGQDTDRYGEGDFPEALAIFKRPISQADPVFHKHQFFSYILSETKEGRCWNQIQTFRKTNSYQIN